MLEMLRDLVAHKGHANAAVLGAIRQNDTAVSDPELCELVHHILIANRFWLLAVLLAEHRTPCRPLELQGTRQKRQNSECPGPFVAISCGQPSIAR